MFMTNIETQDVFLAMEAGQHDFEVEKHQLVTRDGIAIPDMVAVMKTGSDKYLGTVGFGYELVQPKTIYELGEELISSTGGKIDRLFNLRGGRVIGISFELAEKEYVPNDPTKMYFVMLLGFDGSCGIAGHATTSRLSCLNQCNTSSKLYNLRHTKNVLNRIEVVKGMMTYYQNEIKAFDEKMTFMAGKSMNSQEAVDWFKSLFPAPKNERAQTRLDNQTATFINCLNNGRGSNIPGVKGTAYGAFQALTEYINHHRATRVHGDRDEDEVRFETIHFGSGHILSQAGLNKLTSSFTFNPDEFFIE